MGVCASAVPKAHTSDIPLHNHLFRERRSISPPPYLTYLDA